MGSASVSTDGRGVSTDWFTDHSPGGGMLGAVVVWRRTRLGRQHHVLAPDGWLRMLIRTAFVRTGILANLWPRGFDAYIHGSFAAADAHRAEMLRDHPPGAGWNSSSGRGEDRIRYNERRRVVGFRGREYGPPPDGHALLLLIRDDEATENEVHVIEASVPTAPLPQRPRSDRSAAKEQRGAEIRAYFMACGSAVNAILEASPAYRGFRGG